MLNPLVSCSVYAFEMLIIYVFFSRISDRKTSALKTFLLGILLFEAGSGINLLFQNNLWINTAVSIGIRILFCILCFDVKPVLAACYSVVLVVLNFALELIAVFVISAITGTETIDYNSNLALLILECSTSKILFFVTCLIMSHIIKPHAGFSKYQLSLFFFPLCSALCLMIFWFICTRNNVTYDIQLLLSVASVIIFGSTVLLFITYQHQIDAESEHLRVKSENERLQTEKSYYDILERQNQQLMIYTHDTKNHLTAIQSLCTDPSIDEYIAKLLNQLKDYSSNCHSGNKMLDVMINKFVIDCGRRGIQFDYYLKSCNLKRLDDIDLVAILGNLMDNAITAAAKSNDKKISLETTQRNGYSVIIISNSCDSAPVIQGGQLVTSKDDKKLHGFGLKSVAKTLKRYNGDFSWEYNELYHEFIVTVMIG